MNTRTADSVGTALWRLDPERSSIEFHVKAIWGLQTIKGGFTRFHGKLDLSGTPAVELTVEADSVDTKNQRRDKHLRSPDFLDAGRHPYIRFVSETATLDGDRLTIHGHLRVRGVSLSLNIVATVQPDDDEIEVEAVTVADHKRLGMTWNWMGSIRTPTTLIVTGRLAQ